ncbi:MAG: helix-hairpin-helix domain-containing protein [Saprospiraceae bacterium]|nr:helix-hairpin-helix domain-containing protein [Saprospiraceae bacterium]
MILFTLCDIPWWLLWLLPLLLLPLLWWLMNNRYNKKVEEYEGIIKGLNAQIGALEEDLAACKSKRSELEGDLAVTKGRMREMEAEMKTLRLEGSASAAGLGLASMDSSSGEDQHSEAENAAEDDAASGSGDSTTLAGLGLASNDISSGDDQLSEAESATEEDASGAVDTATAAALGAITSSFAGGDTDAKAEPTIPVKSIYAGIKADNLQIIEGIGPKMESVLKENGIDSHTALGSKTESELREILNKYGDKYKIIDPKSWPTQAKLAGAGDFESMIALQKKLDGGKSNAAGMTDSKLEKYLIKTGVLKAFKQDDLKAIEGIGPATDKLLRENGINTWRELADSTAEKIQEILTAAGSRFGLSDPTTWPKQAELAADGKFDELREYQDFLDGGKG